MYYYEIYVEDQKGSFTYKSEIKYEIGEWCIINFINRNKAGLVLFEVSEDKITFDLSKLKPIISKAPILSIPNPIMNLIDWMAKYYLSDYYHVIKTAYPGALKLTYSKKAIYLEDLEESKRLDPEIVEKFNEYMREKQEITEATLKKHFSQNIINRAIKEKAIKIEKKINLNSKRKIAQKEKSELIEKNIILNEEQQKAVNEIKESQKQFFLLKGVTGSGKTEIYINLIKEALEKGEGSIFLVPEISLTTQMIQRLEEQFLNSVAILHSKLTEQEKRQEWTYIRKGEKKIVIGARSAVFAPVQNLKYIVVDEEHENTYKQENNPRYHTKNVAIKRALLEKNDVKVILGSATPSFESFYQAKQGDIELIELKKRYKEARLPKYEIINLNEVTENFSDKLLEKISLTLKKKEQVILILNRKSFSTQVRCKDCGNVPKCPNCSISLNYYKNGNKLKCHYCGYERFFNKKCDECGSERMMLIGSGTEKIEEELQEIFSSSKIVRVDSESIKSKEHYEKIYNDFKNQKYDIMLGTQIIAKGLHFPNVTLVGVLNADIIMNFPDFRASEKTFQLLVQSAGRAGRGEKEGEVVIQTFNEENDVIKKTVENDYEGYYENELILRKTFNYPPFGRLIILNLSSTDEKLLEENSKLLYNELENKIKETLAITMNEFISEPFNAPIYKMKGRYRKQIFIKFSREHINKVKNIIRRVLFNFEHRKIRINIDVDPINML